MLVNGSSFYMFSSEITLSLAQNYSPTKQIWAGIKHCVSYPLKTRKSSLYERSRTLSDQMNYKQTEHACEKYVYICALGDILTFRKVIKSIYNAMKSQRFY